MIVIGTDTHKANHTCVAANSATGQLAGELTAAARKPGFGELLGWSRELDSERIWAIEDCRHVSGGFERFLVQAGERVVRAPPKLTGASRRGERTRDKSDPIDALSIARVALREGPETLPAAHLDQQAMEIKLLLGHRDGGRPASGLEREIAALVQAKAPELVALPGCGTLSAANILAETTGVKCISSDAKLARLAGVAPIPASGKRVRHRLDRGGNRQLNCALHRIAVTQGRAQGPARDFLAKKQAEGKSCIEAASLPQATPRPSGLARCSRCPRADSINSLSPTDDFPNLRPAAELALT